MAVSCQCTRKGLSSGVEARALPEERGDGAWYVRRYEGGQLPLGDPIFAPTLAFSPRVDLFAALGDLADDDVCDEAQVEDPRSRKGGGA